jgi:hypothetical protein
MENITGKRSEDCERELFIFEASANMSGKTTDKRDQCMRRDHAIIYPDKPTHVFAKVAVQI